MDGTSPACLKAGQDYNILLEYMYGASAAGDLDRMYAVSSKERATNVAREGIRLGTFSVVICSSKSFVPSNGRYNISCEATLNSPISVTTANEVSKSHRDFLEVLNTHAF
jgi:hypothetical protein